MFLSSTQALPAAQRPLFAVLLGGVWTTLVFGSRPNAGIEEQDPWRQTDGIHVTRLHRYDHSGMSAMLEAEAKWSRGETSCCGSGSSFVQVSSRQLEALQNHHRLAQDQRQRSKQHESEASTLKIMAGRRAARLSRGTSKLYPVTELDRLESQYVGPIGVGTKKVPDGCRAEEERSLAFISAGEVGSDNQTTETCHLQDESNMWVVLDTGSTNLWVNSDLCVQGACADKSRNHYNHNRSITYVRPSDMLQLNITFGTGKVSGVTAIDDIRVGPYTVANQTFGMIQQQEGRVFEEVPFEGILGLAFPKMSANGAQPFFDNVIKQKVLKKNQFSFYFSLDNPSANAIFWGGADKKFYKGDLEHFKVVDPFYWSIPLEHFKIGDEILLSENKAPGGSYLQTGAARDDRKPKAIVDTGTTFFTAESNLYGEVMDRLGTKHCKEVTDKTHPPITFRLRNKEGHPVDFVLNNMQYMTQDGEGNMCSPAFMRIDIPQQHGPAMVLGEVFLRHFFSVFNRGDGSEDDATVGFAKAAHGNDTIRELRAMTKSQPGFIASHSKSKRK